MARVTSNPLAPVARVRRRRERQDRKHGRGDQQRRAPKANDEVPLRFAGHVRLVANTGSGRLLPEQSRRHAPARDRLQLRADAVKLVDRILE